MLNDHLRNIAQAQAGCFRRFVAIDPPEFWLHLHRALVPSDIHKGQLKETPVHKLRKKLDFRQPAPQQLREDAARAGILRVTKHDLEVRRLYPSLDLGVYCASHSIGKPSSALLTSLEEHYGQLPAWGVNAFTVGGWSDVIDDFRWAVAELVGGDLSSGDVAYYANCSDALSAILFAMPRGRLVTTDGHFTTAHYIHQEWAHRTDSEIIRIPLDDQECVSTEVILDALTADTSIVSLSHAFYRNGFLLDVYSIAEAMMDICPEAALLLDAYQTLGTVPLNVERLPVQTAVLGGGIKQLRCGPGVGFAWISHLLLERIKADRHGWWAHAEPLAFDPEFRVGAGAAKLRTGTPGLLPLVALTTELRVLGSSGDGDLRSAIARARLVTTTQVENAVEYARSIGLHVHGPSTPDRRAAFFAIRVEQGNAIVKALEEDGVIVDFRPDEPGSEAGLIRLSANHASFGYELMFAVEQLRVLV